MALNIKDEETEALAAELSKRMGINNKTAAIRYALRQQLSLLESRDNDRLNQALEVLRTEIWPHTAGFARLTKSERESILGYDDAGLPQ